MWRKYILQLSFSGLTDKKGGVGNTLHISYQGQQRGGYIIKREGFVKNDTALFCKCPHTARDCSNSSTSFDEITLVIKKRLSTFVGSVAETASI